jgi:hypothetical protein
VKRDIFAFLFVFLIAIATAQQPAQLHCELKTYPQYGQTNVVVLYVTGGQSNVQYRIDTPDLKNIGATNWSYTYRMYSRDFITPPESAERIVSSKSDPSFRPQQFYRIGGILAP